MVSLLFTQGKKGWVSESAGGKPFIRTELLGGVRRVGTGKGGRIVGA